MLPSCPVMKRPDQARRVHVAPVTSQGQTEERSATTWLLLVRFVGPCCFERAVLWMCSGCLWRLLGSSAWQLPKAGHAPGQAPWPSP